MHRAPTVSAVLWAQTRLRWLDVIPDPIEAQQWIDLWVDQPHLREDIKNKLKSRALGLSYGMRDLQPVSVSDMF